MRGSEIPAQSAKGEERGDRERNPWLAKMRLWVLNKKLQTKKTKVFETILFRIHLKFKHSLKNLAVEERNLIRTAQLMMIPTNKQV